MFQKGKKGKVGGKSKKSATAQYTASPMDLVMGIDFELFDDPKNNWVCIRLLKGKYAGVVYRYNSIGVKEDPKKSKAENLMMTMDYKVVDYGKFSKAIEKEEEFNNTVFNVIYALVMMQSGLDGASEDISEETEE
jgi:hypothetical protein